MFDLEMLWDAFRDAIECRGRSATRSLSPRTSGDAVGRMSASVPLAPRRPPAAGLFRTGCGPGRASRLDCGPMRQVQDRARRPALFRRRPSTADESAPSGPTCPVPAGAVRQPAKGRCRRICPSFAKRADRSHPLPRGIRRATVETRAVIACRERGCQPGSEPIRPDRILEHSATTAQGGTHRGVARSQAPVSDSS